MQHDPTASLLAQGTGKIVAMSGGAITAPLPGPSAALSAGLGPALAAALGPAIAAAIAGKPSGSATATGTGTATATTSSSKSATSTLPHGIEPEGKGETGAKLAYILNPTGSKPTSITSDTDYKLMLNAPNAVTKIIEALEKNTLPMKITITN